MRAARKALLIAASAACLGAAVLFGALHFSPSTRPLPSFDDVRTSFRPSEAYLLDRKGEVVHTLRVDPGVRRLAWTKLEEVSPALTKAVLRSEDKRFYRHRGVDWIALAAAGAGRLSGGPLRGASTITMQLASILPGGPNGGGTRKSLRRKFHQAQAALALERRWSKEEILEAYLNLVPLRGELTGIAAAARGLFGKRPDGLNEAESLVLAVLIRSPNAPFEQVASRATRLARALGSTVDERDLKSLTEGTLNRHYAILPDAAFAPHVAHLLLGKGTDNVVSTLDAGLQRFASEVILRQVSYLHGRNVRDGAVLVVENRTGHVQAYVGNTGMAASARFVDGVRARRQAGSTLKPFLYGLAFEGRILTPASLLDDSPLEVPTGAGMYAPKNYDRRYRGLVTARTALSASLNTPAVRTAMLIGPDAFARRLRAMGFEAVRDGEEYGTSLALGTADVSLAELVDAYRAVANGGYRTKMTLLPRKVPPGGKRVLSPEAAFIVSDILSDRGARSTTFGLENMLATPFWAAVKTGTSKDMRDNWCIGYSKQYTVGVWVGNFSGEPMWDVSGISGAAPAWAEIMDYLHRGSLNLAPAPPPGIVPRHVEFPDEAEEGRTDWFIKGTEPAGPRQTIGGAAGPRIRYPLPGTIVALDPDIPEGRQVLFFEAENGAGGFAWILNGERLGPADATLPWRPLPGKFTISLADETGRVAASVDFSVRGDPLSKPRTYSTDTYDRFSQ